MHNPPPDPSPNQQQPSNYREEVLTWRSQQDDRLRSPRGWLALSGHFWLKSGANTLGTSEDCDVVLPKEMGANCKAVLHVLDSSIQLQADEQAGFQYQGKPVSSIKLSIDQTRPESDSPTELTVDDRFRLQLVRRNQRLAIRVRDSQNKSIRDFRGKKWFDLDPKFRVLANYKPYDPPRSITIVNVRGDTVPSEIVGQLAFEIDNQQFTLDALSESSDSLFILFKDKTNGQSTYGPGRFIDADQPVDGKVVLDFNKAYNPPCAFNPNTLCPIPPKQNRLNLEVTAGEKIYAAD
ncbi:MAG: DUF1684 domain-containing protein [Pirellula sp.]